MSKEEKPKFKEGQIVYVPWHSTPDEWRQQISSQLVAVRMVDYRDDAHPNSIVHTVGPAVETPIPTLAKFHVAANCLYGSVREYLSAVSRQTFAWLCKHNLETLPAGSDLVVVVNEQIRRVLPLPREPGALDYHAPDALREFVCNTTADELSYEVVDRDVVIEFARDVNITCGPEATPDELIGVLTETLEHAFRVEQAALRDALVCEEPDALYVAGIKNNLNRYAAALERAGVVVDQLA